MSGHPLPRCPPLIFRTLCKSHRAWILKFQVRQSLQNHPQWETIFLSIPGTSAGWGVGRWKDGRGISQEEKVEEDAARRVGTKGGGWLRV